MKPSNCKNCGAPIEIGKCHCSYCKIKVLAITNPIQTTNFYYSFLGEGFVYYFEGDSENSELDACQHLQKVV